MSEHTPGPWSMHRGVCPCRIIWDATGKVVVAVAHSHHWSETIDDSYPADAGADANARLIAAAPELLATLKDVIAHLRSITLDPGDDEDDAPALTAAEALIAKAEGRDS